MKDRLSLALAALALLFLVGVAYVGKTMPLEPPTRQYTLDITRTKVDGDIVLAAGKTNLPSGARLTLYVDRMYRTADEKNWQSVRIGEKEIAVEGDTWDAAVPVDDSQWVHRLEQQVERHAISSVQDVHSKLRTTVVFSPLIPQAQSVVDSMGPGFERLAQSDGATRAGEHWMLRRNAVLDKPLPHDREEDLMTTGG